MEFIGSTLYINIRQKILILIKGEITKKITKFSFFILAFLILNCKKSLEPISQPTWHLIYNAPINGHYHDIFFVDQNNGWVVGDSAKILHTSDGGNTWEKQVSKGRKVISLYSVCFTDSQIGWAVGDDHEIIRTTNSGRSWTDVTPPLPQYILRLNSVFFINRQNGWIAHNRGNILYTKDGGNTWNGSVVGWELDLLSVYFIDEMKGWTIAKNNIVFYTIDGGITWNQQQINNISCDSSSSFNDVIFVDDRNGWISTSSKNVNNANIYHTNNGGQEWFCQVSLSDTNLNSIHFINKNTGWVIGNKIFHTRDGGSSWKLQYNSSDDKFVSISFVDDTHGWVLSSKGKVYKYEVH